MMDGNLKRLSIWGTSRAGKTVFLISLFWAFQNLQNEWRIQADDPDSETFLDSAREDFFVKHRFPEKTVDTKTYYYTLTRKKNGKDEAVFKLEFIDSPGELYAEYYDISPDKKNRNQKVRIDQRNRQAQESKLTPKEMFDFLSLSQGIIVLLDPAWKDNSRRNQPYNQLLAQVFRDLERKHRDSLSQPYIALCYTKMDATNELWKFTESLYDVVTNPTGFNPLNSCYRHITPQANEAQALNNTNPCSGKCKVFEELGRKLLEDQLELPYDHFACFHISSIGRVKGKELNIGDQVRWERDEIIGLHPPAFIDEKGNPILEDNLDYMRKAPGNTYVNETYEPTSINNANDINPYKVIEPIKWLLDKIR